MKNITLNLFAVLFPLILLNSVSAQEIWSIGTTDSSYSEFFAAKDYEAVAKRAVSGEWQAANKTDAKEFPWILPGPVDTWAGSKFHSVNIPFDLPDDLPEAPVCVLELTGIGQGRNTPLLEIELNGEKQNIQTERGKTGDQILKTAEGAEWKTYKTFFQFNVLKKTGNTLSIKNSQGSWFVFDSLKFRTDDGVIKTFTITPLPGIYRYDDNSPTRRFDIIFDTFITKPATLHVTNLDNPDSPNSRVRDTVLPAGVLYAQGISTFPNPEKMTDELHFEVTLKQDGAADITKRVTLPAERKWEVHLIHQTHLDIGYTHLQTDILKRQVQSIRDALKYIDETKDYPDEAKFRFHPEGMWAVDQFLKEATDEEKAAFIKAAKNRDLHIDGMYAQAMTGMYNDEEIFELFGNAVRFCHKNDIVLDSAMQTDVPGYTWGLVTAMAQNGIKYMTMGPNCGHRVGRLYEWGGKPFWWESPSGKEKVLCWLLDTGYHQFHGKPLDYVFTANDIFRILSGEDHIKRERDDHRTFLFENLVVIRYGVEGDNGRPSRILSDTVKAWNEKYLYPKLIISRNSDVMRLLEQRYSDKLPTVRGDYTPYWEDGSASTSEATAINRRAKERLIQAETLYAMLGAKDYPKDDFDAAWTNLIMYDEHTWGAHNSISEPDSDFVKTQDEYKQNYARNGAEQTAKLVVGCRPPGGNVGDSRPKPVGEYADATAWKSVAYLLVNTLSRKRNGITFIGNDLAQAPTVRVSETDDGKPITVQSVPDPDGKNVSIYADLGWGANAPSIPALGTLRLKDSAIKPEEKTGVFRINTETGEMKNSKVRLVIDTQTGAIKSLKLVGSEHDFVKEGDDGNSGLNDYLYIIGRDAEENRERIKSNVKLTVVADGPLVASVLVEVPDSLSFKSLKRQITLFADNDKVRIVNVIDKNLEYKPEGMFFGFPFNVPNGKWYVDTPWALVEVEKDQIPGANRNYYSVQRYCTLANENCGVNWVTVDANMVQFAPILFTPAWGLQPWRKNWEDGQPGGTLYSWVCNNHWETNYKAGQDGQLTFEYWIWPYVKASFNNGIAQRFARQVHQPVLSIPAVHQPEASTTGILTLANEGNVITTSVKPARDGSGAIIVRLFNPTTSSQPTKTVPAEPYKAVYKSNPLEEKLSPLAELELNPQETITIRIE